MCTGSDRSFSPLGGGRNGGRKLIGWTPMKVTQKNILLVPEGKYRLSDNLRLIVKSDVRYFSFRYQIGKKRSEISLGNPAYKTIAAAKAEAVKMNLLVSQGINPKTERQKAKAIIDPTFQQFFEDALPTIENTRRYKSPETIKIYSRMIRQYAFPTFGDIPMSQIRNTDILNSLIPIWETKTRTASMYRSFLEIVFTHARSIGLMTIPNPATWRGNLDAFLPSESRIRIVKHHAAASLELTSDIFHACILRKSIGLKALSLIILTACRENEITSLKWSECHFDERTIYIPPERRKDGQPYPHRIPMSDQTEMLLRSMPHVNDFVFPFKDSSIRTFSPRKSLYGLKLQAPATVHGFRSTFRDWAAEAGIDPVLAEKSLMHKTGNTVEQAYQRSDLLEQRRPVMQAWADELIGVSDLDNLIKQSLFPFDLKQ